MNDKDLNHIIMITETGNLTKAAKRLFIAQPSLSQNLNKIEQEIGTPLFIRSKEGMKPTLAGELYYKMAKDILNIYDDFISEISYINEMKKGRVSLGVVNFLGSVILPEILPSFKKEYPNIDVFVKEELTTPLVNMILDSKIELGIFHTHPNFTFNGLNYEILNRDKFVLVTSKNKYGKNKKQISRNDIINQNFIALNTTQGIRKISDIICEDLELVPNIKFLTKNVETAVSLVSKDMGVTIMPLNYLERLKAFNEISFYEIKGSENAYWESCVATRKNGYVSNISKTLIEYIKNFYKNNSPI